MAVFFPQPLNKFFFGIFLSKRPPQEEPKFKNAQFLQYILKDDVYIKKITVS